MVGISRWLNNACHVAAPWTCAELFCLQQALVRTRRISELPARAQLRAMRKHAQEPRLRETFASEMGPQQQRHLQAKLARLFSNGPHRFGKHTCGRFPLAFAGAPPLRSRFRFLRHPCSLALWESYSCLNSPRNREQNGTAFPGKERRRRAALAPPPESPAAYTPL